MPSQTPVFRLATVEDLDELVRLRLLMQKEVNRASDEDVDSAFMDSAREYFVSALKDGTYLSAVAELDEKLVSANGLVLYTKPPSLSGRRGRIGYVTNVYTMPEWRGNGFATELMRVLVAHAKSAGVDKLHLGATDSGKAVYERVGFQAARWAALELRL